MTVDSRYTIKGGENYVWTSDNPVVASVVDNVVEAHKVGEARLVCDVAKFTVVVKGLYNLFDQPCIAWGDYMSDVQVKMLKEGYTQQDAPAAALQYKGKGKATTIFYSFVERKLVQTEVQIAKKNVNTASEVHAYLKERYMHISETEEVFYYKTLDGKTDIIFSTYTTTSPNEPYKIVYKPAK